MTDTYFVTYDDGRPDQWVFVEGEGAPPVVGEEGVASAELQVYPADGPAEEETPAEEATETPAEEAAEPAAEPVAEPQAEPTVAPGDEVPVVSDQASTAEVVE